MLSKSKFEVVSRVGAQMMRLISILIVLLLLLLIAPQEKKNESTLVNSQPLPIEVKDVDDTEIAPVSQEALYREYLALETDYLDMASDIEKLLGKSYDQFTEMDYLEFLSLLDFKRDQDIFLWSSMTGIYVVALSKTSYFFRKNLHLMTDMERASQVSMSQAYQYQSYFDSNSNQLSVIDERGDPVSLRSVPNGVILPVEHADNTWHYRHMIEPKIHFDLLKPYLIAHKELLYRPQLGDWIKKIPFDVVKSLRGKAMYLTNHSGRSFTTTMPVSNTVYTIHVGLVAGVWVEVRSDGVKGTAINFIHELGHLFDYIVLQGGYGTFQESFQYPEFRRLNSEKESIFGYQEDQFEASEYGFISKYAKTNAQESFAEHFRAYIDEQVLFQQKAQQQDLEGYPELQEKYDFLKRVFSQTDIHRTRLDQLEKANDESED